MKRLLDFQQLNFKRQCTNILDGLYIQTEQLPAEEQERFRAEVNAKILELALKHGLTVWDAKAYIYPKMEPNPALWNDSNVYQTYTAYAAVMIRPFVLKGTDQGSTKMEGPKGEDGSVDLIERR